MISLCRVDELFREHPVGRELYVIDQEADDNAALGAVVRDAVDSIDAFQAERLPVVVLCHGGASRTALVLRAWLMRTNGWDEPTPTQFLEDRWPMFGSVERVVRRVPAHRMGALTNAETVRATDAGRSSLGRKT